MFSAMFVEKMDAMILRPMNCPANQEPGCRPCWGGTCESLSNYQQLSCKGQCNPGCVCKKDHYLQNNQCVHVSECNVQCPANMVFNPCVKKTITCKTLNSGAVEYDECEPRCECVEGYIFSGEKPQDCVKMSECQNQTNAS
ncbi:alpha-tectorin-like isoform X1 [Bufo bufo]|uniref:alpha-tectorin-like isoform X1 n=2 Tax=Bufo bufo TaxID=8384 RepID=UPI001ABDCBF0|nr:alpha-tectorin-like isoform X1 [Bufo bufo]